MACGSWPQDLHDAMRIGAGSSGWFKIAFPAGDGEQQRFGQAVLECGGLEAG